MTLSSLHLERNLTYKRLFTYSFPKVYLFLADKVTQAKSRDGQGQGHGGHTTSPLRAKGGSQPPSFILVISERRLGGAPELPHLWPAEDKGNHIKKLRVLK